MASVAFNRNHLLGVGLCLGGIGVARFCAQTNRQTDFEPAIPETAGQMDRYCEQHRQDDLDLGLPSLRVNDFSSNPHFFDCFKIGDTRYFSDSETFSFYTQCEGGARFLLTALQNPNLFDGGKFIGWIDLPKTDFCPGVRAELYAADPEFDQSGALSSLSIGLKGEEQFGYCLSGSGQAFIDTNHLDGENPYRVALELAEAAIIKNVVPSALGHQILCRGR